jgi:hypothetical protein
MLVYGYFNLPYNLFKLFVYEILSRLFFRFSFTYL